MFAKPADSGIAIAIEQDLEKPDPNLAKAMEIIHGDSGTDRDDSDSGE